MPLQVDGQSIPAYSALYVATMQDSSDTLKQASTTLANMSTSSPDTIWCKPWS